MYCPEGTYYCDGKCYKALGAPNDFDCPDGATEECQLRRCQDELGDQAKLSSNDECGRTSCSHASAAFGINSIV